MTIDLSIYESKYIDVTPDKYTGMVDLYWLVGWLVFGYFIPNVIMVSNSICYINGFSQ